MPYITLCALDIICSKYFALFSHNAMMFMIFLAFDYIPSFLQQQMYVSASTSQCNP